MIGRWFMNLNDASVARGELDVQRAGAFPAKCHADAIFIDAQVEDVFWNNAADLFDVQ